MAEKRDLISIFAAGLIFASTMSGCGEVGCDPAYDSWCGEQSSSSEVSLSSSGVRPSSSSAQPPSSSSGTAEQSSSSSSSSSSSAPSSNSFSLVGGCPIQSSQNGSVTCGGQKYKTVVIGTQTWFAENLNYGASRSRCYNNDASNCDIYGRLYDWATAMGFESNCNSSICSSQIQSPHRGICPAGWHIPSNEDWDKLYRYIDSTSGTSSPCYSHEAGRHLKATSGWGICGPAGSVDSYLCEDTYGFSALPGGIGDPDGSFAGGVGNYSTGFWWSASESYSESAYCRYLYYTADAAGWCGYDKPFLFSVRCLKD